MNVIKLEEMGTILMHIALQYTHPDFESMYSDWSTVHDIGEKLVKMSDQPQLNENQQMMSEAGLIGVIYSQLLEEFGFGYIDKDLWMIAENLSEKIANEQPQLNENQQKWINRLTINYSWYGETAQHALHATLQEPEMPDLPQNEFFQVLEVFSRWALEQEEE